MKSKVFWRSGIATLALAFSSLTFNAAASLLQTPTATDNLTTTTTTTTATTQAAAGNSNTPEKAASQTFSATAYTLRGRTASGSRTRRGVIAADRRILPLGTRVRLETTSGHSGEYIVSDTGGAVKGRKIDIWVPSNGEAMRFGRRNVKLTVMSYPRGKQPKTVAKAAATKK